VFVRVFGGAPRDLFSVPAKRSAGGGRQTPEQECRARARRCPPSHTHTSRRASQPDDQTKPCLPRASAAAAAAHSAPHTLARLLSPSPRARARRSLSLSSSLSPRARPRRTPRKQRPPHSLNAGARQKKARGAPGEEAKREPPRQSAAPDDAADGRHGFCARSQQPRWRRWPAAPMLAAVAACSKNVS
jgi:hypothetical protein